MLIVVVGLCFGIPCGAWFGKTVTGMYAKLFHFPHFAYHLTYDVALIASLVSVVAAALGAWGAIHRAVALPPAEAAAIMKVSEEDVLAAIKDGSLKAKKLGNAYRISKGSLEEFLKG